MEVTIAPKVDKYISEFLGKKFPKERDTELAKVQTAILACIRPLTSAWQDLLEEGLDEDTGMTVPATDVLSVIQRTLCLIGNASEFVSQTRRSKILESIDQSWSKFGSDEYKTKDTLFGEEFQASLTGKVEKDVALSKAVSILKRSKKGREEASTSTRRDGQSSGRFFRRGPPAQYGGRQGRNTPTYTPRNTQFRERDSSRGRRPFHQAHRFHEPTLPQANGSQPHPHKKTQ